MEQTNGKRQNPLTTENTAKHINPQISSMLVSGLFFLRKNARSMKKIDRGIGLIVVRK